MSRAWSVAVSCLLLLACGDSTSAEGDQGLLRFTLVTDYEVPQSDLRDATIVAGHRQELDVELTQAGASEIDDPELLVYEVTPEVEVESIGAGEGDPPDLGLLVSDPGRYRIDALVDGLPVDGIDLEFDRTASIELSVRVRVPWEEDFLEVPEGEVTTVVEGTQATFLPIPLGAGGERLAGDIETEGTVDPRWSVVPGASLGGLYEDGYWTVSGEIDFYFIEPADTTVTITDTVSGGSGSHQFVVEAVDQGG
jgi:hypothetical protein